MFCAVCGSPELSMWLPDAVAPQCALSSMTLDGAAVATATATALLEAARIQGTFWLDDGDNATLAVQFLLAHMPRRDMQLLFSNTFAFLDWMLEGVRMALSTWPWASARGVSWPIFLENVVPFAVLDEKRDLAFNWRPRMLRLFGPLVASAPNITAAMHIVADAIPRAFLSPPLALGANASWGPPLSWHSEYSPAMLSPEQVVSACVCVCVRACVRASVGLVPASRLVV